MDFLVEFFIDIFGGINKDVVSRLDDYCNIAGQQKGIAIERAINMYIDDFEEKQKIIKKSEGHI